MATLYNHPDYLQKQPNWIKARDLYEGRHEVLTRGEYLWYHQIERNTGDPTASNIRRSREERTRYLNFSEILISLLTSLFFKNSPRPDNDLSKLLEQTDAASNIDGFGTNLESFIKDNVLSSLLNYGKVVILVDSFPLQPANLGEQIDRKIRPYMELIEPLKAMDWGRESLDSERLGEWNFFRYEFEGVLPRKRASDEPQLRRYSHELYLDAGRYAIQEYYVGLDKNFNVTPEHWDNKSQSAEWITGDIRATDFDHIPISVYESESWLKDANEESLRYFNIRSNRDNIIYQQGYQDKYVTNIDPTDVKRIRAVSEYVTKLLPENSNAFAIEPVDPIAYEKAEREAISNVFKVGLNRLRDLPIDSRESQSSESVDKQNEFTFALIQSELSEIENVVNDALRDFAAFYGASDFEGKIGIEREISEEDFDQFRNTWFAFKDLFTQYPEIQPEIAKKALKKLKIEKEKEQELMQLIGDKEIIQETEETEPDRVLSILNGGRR